MLFQAASDGSHMTHTPILAHRHLETAQSLLPMHVDLLLDAICVSWLLQPCH
jgi:hypothetical protein